MHLQSQFVWMMDSYWKAHASMCNISLITCINHRHHWPQSFCILSITCGKEGFRWLKYQADRLIIIVSHDGWSEWNGLYQSASLIASILFISSWFRSSSEFHWYLEAYGVTPLQAHRHLFVAASLPVSDELLYTPRAACASGARGLLLIPGLPRKNFQEISTVVCMLFYSRTGFPYLEPICWCSDSGAAATSACLFDDINLKVYFYCFSRPLRFSYCWMMFNAFMGLFQAQHFGPWLQSPE